ncbi:MAG TPA: hypothetical protein VH853_14720 [Polyangia bacterium]|jgi:hypothetical protein|nr:hypothetical protein [Polyangia bacterium]
MRTVSTLVGLTLVALSAGARADDRPPPAAPVPAAEAAAVAPAPVMLELPPSPRQHWLVGLSFLPMGAGRLTIPVGAMEVTSDASFAYGFSLSASYLIIGGLSVGVAPQAIYNVQDKVNPSQLAAPPAAKEYDLMARVAYTFPVVETIGIYLEALPGYSLITLAKTATAKGFVLGFGGGVAMAVSERTFANLGVGYQIGFQSISNGAMNVDDRSRYLRVELGGGVKF